MTTACTVCRIVDVDDAFACDKCQLEVRANLEELAGPRGLFARLIWAGPDLLIPGARRGNSERVSTSKTEAPSPVSLTAVNLLGAGGMLHTLQRWVGTWFPARGWHVPQWRGPQHFSVSVDPEGRRVSRPGQLDYAVSALVNSLEWATVNRDDFGRFAAQVCKLVRDAESALNPDDRATPRVYIGRCPHVDGTTREVCGARLEADPFAYSITCGRCRTAWSRQEWPELSDRIAG